jgi:hypothetical protein
VAECKTQGVEVAEALDSGASASSEASASSKSVGLGLFRTRKVKLE